MGRPSCFSVAVPFTHERRSVGEAVYLVATAGSGPPVLMLHGFPQTHAWWHGVALRLSEEHALVAPDLRGYGQSEAPAGAHGEGFSQRLAQPPFPERILEADPEAVLELVFGTWAGDPGAVAAEAHEAYLRAFDPSTIAAVCGDFRASFYIGRGHDAEDRRAGRKIEAPLPGERRG